MNASIVRKATERLQETMGEENGWFNWIDSEDIQTDVDNGTIDLWRTSGGINVEKLIEVLSDVIEDAR